MKDVSIPWGNWYSQNLMKLSFPNEWDVVLCGMEQRKALSEEDITKRIDSPIGTQTIEKLADNRKSACIVIDDISRPTKGSNILPIIIRKLLKSGIPADKITVLLALGAHRPMTRQDMEKKLGNYVLETVAVINHNPFSNDLVTISSMDEDIIKVNRLFMQADLRILVGCIVPHTLAGFSGGAKNIIPGIGGIETLESNHKLTFSDISKSKEFKTNTANPDNAVRNNMEFIGRKCGIDFIVNIVLTDKLEIADAFAGHFIQAHRAACKCALEFYRTRLVPDADIVVLNAYPKDTEYNQIGSAFSVLGHYKRYCFKDTSSLVLATAASEGAGYHALFGPGMRLFVPHDDNTPPAEIKHINTCIFSTGVNNIQIKQYYNNLDIPVYKKWEDVLALFLSRHKEGKVAIYPNASMQIGYI